MPGTISLTTRLSAFFLGALALVLAGFSLTLFGLARSTLARQEDERLDAALRTLIAAVEFNPEGLEWEPNQRLVALGRDHDPGAIRWTVRDPRGALLSGSVNLPAPDFLDGINPPEGPETRRLGSVRHGGRRYRVLQRAIEPEWPIFTERRAHHYPRLVLTAAADVAPTETTLQNLARTEAGLSLTIWLLASAACHALCRRALAPVARMADAARAMSPAEIDQRLPEPETGDELGELAESFNGLLDRLQDAFERQRRFTGDASHQLRTPLAVMIGQIDVALRRPRAAEDYQRVLSRVRDQAANLNQIVEALLFLARADADAVRPASQPLDLTAWARDHVERWATHPRAADLTLAPMEESVAVRVHPPLLAQLVDNLIDNALKYTEPGTGVRVRVAPAETPAGPVARLAVEDDGPGIAPEDQPHLFEPFFRAPWVRQNGRPGIGLGLPVAQRIAAAFEGTLDVRSAPGQGCAFVLTLPRVSRPGRFESEDEDDAPDVATRPALASLGADDRG